MNENKISGILKLKRKELGLSVKSVLKSLSEHGINISDKTFYGWESGYRQPDADTFIILCEIYGISTLYEIDNTVNSGLTDVKKTSQNDNESLSEDDAAVMLYQALISAGFLKDGEDLTPRQFEFLDGLTAMLSAFFDS